MPVRLQKFLAEAGVASRRASETLIRQGRVAVNSTVVTTLGTKIEPATDRVTVNGQPVAAERKVYVALHKPPGYHCTSRDTHGRARVLDLLPATLPRLFTVGRLDADSEGLLLLTNDGNFGLRLTHPRYKMPKSYVVEVAGKLLPATAAQLVRGVGSDGERLRAEQVTVKGATATATTLVVVLRQGRNRQIRRMCAAVGHPVHRLVRRAIGRLELGNLKQGEWRFLSHEEVEYLQQG